MNPLRGIALKLVSVLLFITMSAMIKATSDHVPAGEAVFFRSFFAIPVILIWLAWRHELKTGWRTSNPFGHLWRGLVGTASMGLGFGALAYLPLPEVTAIGYTAPLLTVIFAAMFLGEQVRAFRITCVAIGMAGVLIVVWPRLSVLDGSTNPAEALGAIMVLSSAVFAALAQVFVRKLVQSEQTATIVFWFSVNAALLSLVTLPYGWVIPTVEEAALLITAGLIGGLGQIFLTSSYRSADASVIAPFDYASMLFALLFGWFFFDEVPTLTMLAGAALVISAGVLIIWRERRLGMARARQRKAMPPGT
ncbi:MAG: DMT family transporter [Cypionkella sp.]|jgi:drug/metabolite transporter (DMT)-like permease|nr:DMT family transporter [Cypionkella sp.]